LILRPKDTYDGAVFSGNSAMAYNLVKLYQITGDALYDDIAERQLQFMCREAKRYPAGHAMFLVALSDYLDPPAKVTVVERDGRKEYYICQGQTCRPMEDRDKIFDEALQ